MGMLIADRLLKRERLPLDGLRQFYGSGVYAIYYEGDFPAYRPIRGTDTPIYVGKVDPADRYANTPVRQEQRLWRRLSNEHARAVQSAEIFDVADFTCRYLAVVSAWHTTAETHLMNAFNPVWNEKVCDGLVSTAIKPRHVVTDDRHGISFISDDDGREVGTDRTCEQRRLFSPTLQSTSGSISTASLEYGFPFVLYRNRRLPVIQNRLSGHSSQRGVRGVHTCMVKSSTA
jgi:hypothetical protein